MKLTKEILFKWHFRGEGKGLGGSPLYRLEVPNYAFEIQMELNPQYPDDNPNSGILSLYSAPIKNVHMHSDEEISVPIEETTIDVIEWEDDTHRGGINFIDFEELNQPIAWHVNTVERFNSIYTALTLCPPLES